MAADALSEAGPCRIRPYFDLGIETPGWGGEALSADIAAHCLRGVIFGDAPQALSHTPLLEHPQVPVVVPSTFVCPRALHVGQSFEDGFGPRAMAWARAEGFRRVGVLTVFGPAPERWRDMAERAGLQTQPAWIQGVDRFDRSWLRHGLEVVVGAASRERPEVLVLTDDHLVDPAVEELQRMKIRVPEDLVVIAHWNFPLPYTGALPVRLLGPDMREFLRLAIQRVDEHLRGKPIPRTRPSRPGLARRSKRERCRPVFRACHVRRSSMRFGSGRPVAWKSARAGGAGGHSNDDEQDRLGDGSP